jgi:hypothetical protein
MEKYTALPSVNEWFKRANKVSFTCSRCALFRDTEDGHNRLDGAHLNPSGLELAPVAGKNCNEPSDYI